MGRCIYFLLMPPNHDLHQLLTLHDDYYCQPTIAYHQNSNTTTMTLTANAANLTATVRRRSQRFSTATGLLRSPSRANGRHMLCASELMTGKSWRRKLLPALPSSSSPTPATIAAILPPQRSADEVATNDDEQTAADVAELNAAAAEPMTDIVMTPLSKRRCKSLESMPNFRQV